MLESGLIKKKKKTVKDVSRQPRDLEHATLQGQPGPFSHMHLPERPLHSSSTSAQTCSWVWLPRLQWLGRGIRLSLATLLSLLIPTDIRAS